MHLAIALAAKPATPKAPLWVLLVATGVLDLLCFMLMALDIEPEPEIPDEPAAEADEERPPLAGTVLGERVDWQPLANLSSLSAYTGELIELRMTDGTQIRVTLDAIQGNSLKVTQKVGGGAMGYSVNLDLVDEVWVVK